MNDHVLDRLPLWVGGDVEVSEAAAIEAHLARCERCRAEADTYLQSQAWLKDAGVPPFGAEDREALRRAVLAQVASAPSVGRRWVEWGAAALAAASVLVLTLRRAKPVPPEAPPSRIAAKEAPPPASTPVPTPRVARHHAASRRPTLVRVSAPEPSRIEIQTANPRIRIIWLARATQAEPPSLSTKETS